MKKIKIIGCVLAIILAFPFHFGYNIFPNFITSIIFPVNESIMEHMKIIFGCIILSGIIQKIISIKKGLKINNICFSNFVAAIVCIIIFLVMFLPTYYIIGENFIVTILIMILSIIISEYVSYLILKLKDLKLENVTILLVLLFYMFFAITTYFPPKCPLYIDPITNKYGISKQL